MVNLCNAGKSEGDKADLSGKLVVSARWKAGTYGSGSS